MAKMKQKKFDKELSRLQEKLCVLQEWVKEKGLRVIVVFEGRDAAGKGGTIKAITERVSPRVFRLVALPAPSDREKSQMYVQRYMQHFPAAGEIVIFDRSWYNRAGVEPVMGFCTKEQNKKFLETTPAVAAGIAAGTAAVLRVPFTAVLLATLLIGSSAADVAPIAVLAAATGWLVAVALPNPEDRHATGEPPPEPAT